LSSAPAQARVQRALPPRRLARYRLTVPVDVTVLVSGVPQNVPGRSLDLCEGGLAAVLAADLKPGDVVGVEFRLPDLGLALHAKAVIRHQAALRYGMEFMALSPAHRAMIRYWASHLEQPLGANASASPLKSLEAAPASGQSTASSARGGKSLRTALWVMLAASFMVGGLGWWQWYRTWQELDARVPGKSESGQASRLRVPASAMMPLLIHRVEAAYPDAAQQHGVQGVVVLDAVIGTDGRVLELHPTSGPPALTQAATDTVKWWRFQPYRVDGQPVEVETSLAVEFRPQS